MTFGAQVRFAGAVVCIVGAFASSATLSLIGLTIIAVGSMWQIDSLERRVQALEPKEKNDEED